MKVLFVCHYNVGRSQMAKALYNHLTNSNNADSAGTEVIEEGQTIAERKKTSTSSNFYVIDVMNDIGIDVSAAVRTQIKPEMLSEYDKIISMAEENESPEWLLKASNYVHWGVKDPRGQSFDITAKSRDDIKLRVEELINSQKQS